MSSGIHLSELSGCESGMSRHGHLSPDTKATLLDFLRQFLHGITVPSILLRHIAIGRPYHLPTDCMAGHAVVRSNQFFSRRLLGVRRFGGCRDSSATNSLEDCCHECHRNNNRAKNTDSPAQCLPFTSGRVSANRFHTQMRYGKLGDCGVYKRTPLSFKMPASSV